MVGAARFELATSSPPEKRSTKLSHAPTAQIYLRPCLGPEVGMRSADFARRRQIRGTSVH